MVGSNRNYLKDMDGHVEIRARTLRVSEDAMGGVANLCIAEPAFVSTHSDGKPFTHLISTLRPMRGSVLLKGTLI